jgi:hypothetical protein
LVLLAVDDPRATMVPALPFWRGPGQINREYASLAREIANAKLSSVRLDAATADG